MGKILITLFVVIIVSNIILLTVFSQVKEYYYNGLNSRINWVNNLIKEPKIVILGPSTANYGFDPLVISNRLSIENGEVINLSNNAQSPIESYYLYKKYISSLKNVKLFIYPIEPWLFSTKYYYYKDELLTVQADLPVRYYSIVLDRKSNVFKAMLGGVPNSVLQRSLTGCFGSYEFPNSVPSNYGSDSLSALLKPKNIPRAVNEYFAYPAFGFSALQFEQLKKLKQEIEQNGGEIIFVIMPRKKDWIESYRLTCKDIDSVFVKHFNESVGLSEIISGTDMLNNENTENCFVDGFHLNSYGKKVFSEEFAQKLKENNYSVKISLRSLY